MKPIRVFLGMLLCILGVVLTIIPGSSLLLLAGLVLLSIDYKPARKTLKWVQKGMAKTSRAIDSFLINRKLR